MKESYPFGLHFLSHLERWFSPDFDTQNVTKTRSVVLAEGPPSEICFHMGILRPVMRNPAAEMLYKVS